MDTSQKRHAFCFRSRSSRRFFSVGLRKYSPDSSCRSICTWWRGVNKPLFRPPTTPKSDAPFVEVEQEETACTISSPV